MPGCFWQFCKFSGSIQTLNWMDPIIRLLSCYYYEPIQHEVLQCSYSIVLGFRRGMSVRSLFSFRMLSSNPAVYETMPFIQVEGRHIKPFVCWLLVFFCSNNRFNTLNNALQDRTELQTDTAKVLSMGNRTPKSFFFKRWDDACIKLQSTVKAGYPLVSNNSSTVTQEKKEWTSSIYRVQIIKIDSMGLSSPPPWAWGPFHLPVMSWNRLSWDCASVPSGLAEGDRDSARKHVNVSQDALLNDLIWGATKLY